MYDGAPIPSERAASLSARQIDITQLPDTPWTASVPPLIAKLAEVLPMRLVNYPGLYVPDSLVDCPPFTSLRRLVLSYDYLSDVFGVGFALTGSLALTLLERTAASSMERLDLDLQIIYRCHADFYV